MAKITKTREQELPACLHEWVKEGDTVYVIPRGVAKPGMSRRIDLVTFRDGSARHLTYAMSQLGIAGMKGRPNDYKGASIPGCGMYMGFYAVDSLSWRLFGKGGALKHEWL